jgi:hypothetical protein
MQVQPIMLGGRHAAQVFGQVADGHELAASGVRFIAGQAGLLGDLLLRFSEPAIAIARFDGGGVGPEPGLEEQESSGRAAEDVGEEAAELDHLRGLAERKHQLELVVRSEIPRCRQREMHPRPGCEVCEAP